jgi:hypothetical protein
MNDSEYELAMKLSGLMKEAIESGKMSSCQAIGVMVVVQESIRRTHMPTFREGTSDVMRELHGVKG